MKINQITFKVAKLDDPTAKAIGIAVSTDGAVAKELGMSRDQLTALGFDGKVGQTLLLPTSKTKLTIAVGIGEAAKANADVLRNVAAALARASAKVSSLSTSLATAGRGDRTAIAQAVTEGLILATHRYDALKRQESDIKVNFGDACCARSGDDGSNQRCKAWRDDCRRCLFGARFGKYATSTLDRQDVCRACAKSWR